MMVWTLEGMMPEVPSSLSNPSPTSGQFPQTNKLIEVGNLKIGGHGHGHGP